MIELLIVLIWHQEKYEYDFINIAWYQLSTVLRYSDRLNSQDTINIHAWSTWACVEKKAL